MSDTSGPSSLTPLAFFDPDSSCWRMSQGTFLSDSTPCSPTLPASGSMRSGALYALPMSGPATDGPGCSSLPTPTTTNTTSQRAQTGRPSRGPSRGGPSFGLEDVMARLPTPTVGDSKSARNSTAKRSRIPPTGIHAGDTLTDWVTLLPTPTTEPMTGNGHARNLGKEVALLPTPNTMDGIGSTFGGGASQGEDEGWRAAADAAHVRRQRDEASRRRGTSASADRGPDAAHAHSEGSQGAQPAPRRDVPDWGAYGPAIERHAAVLGRPAPNPVDGRGRLNPVFVEWMMMLPAGWVTDIVTNRSKALKALGNGVVPPQAAYALRLLTERRLEAAA
jgi:hypothetical protein